MSKTIESFQYSEKELKEYQSCPQVIFMGNHIAGLRSCPYCAEIFMRYHRAEL